MSFITENMLNCGNVLVLFVTIGQKGKHTLHRFRVIFFFFAMMCCRVAANGAGKEGQFQPVYLSQALW